MVKTTGTSGKINAILLNIIINPQKWEDRRG